MLRTLFAALAIIPVLVGTMAGQSGTSGDKKVSVTLRYLGTAGWEISDGTTVILIDPYISRINGPPPGGSGSRVIGDARPKVGWDDIATPDAPAIDSRISRADFVLITHTHYDHVLDVPHIALKTHASVIGTESTENVMRAYGMPEQQLITVRGGEDYDFGIFSLKVIPSIPKWED